MVCDKDKVYWFLDVIHVHALINNSYDKTKKCTNVKLIFDTHNLS